MRVCHLLAADTTEDDLVSIAQLLAGLDWDRFEQSVASTDETTATRAHRMLGVDVRRVHLRMAGLVGSVGRGEPTARRPHLVHVWSDHWVLLNGLAGEKKMAVVLTDRLARSTDRNPNRYASKVLSRATMVCDSEASYEDLARSGLRAARCVVVPPGTGDDSRGGSEGALTRGALDLPDDDPVLLTVPPPSRRGGQYYAVWATALLQQLLPNVRLILPGESPERARLARFARSFESPEILVCTHYRWQLDRLADVANVLLVPALADVPTGAVVRAMSAGVPVVAGDVPCMRERIEDGETGLLVPSENPTKLAGAALRLIEDDALRRRLIEAARRHVGETYPVGRLVEAYQEAYEKAFDRARTLAMGR